jgi:23S rRNA pseudouridine1911/1915/1917 synthase
LVGKTSNSIRALNQMFEVKTITKTYYAVTIGKMKTEGEITTDIDDKPSESHYKVLDSVDSKRFGQLNFVQLQPKTGRRHQLRKHLASIGNPILGDKDYGIADLILNGKGLYLHAYSLSFIHPFTNESIYITDAFPKRFLKLFPSKITEICDNNLERQK